MLLRKRQTITITPTAPFHFDGTVHKPSHFPDGLSDWIPGTYWQTLHLGAKLFGIRMTNRGTARASTIVITIFAQSTVPTQDVTSIRQELIWRFRLRDDLGDFLSRVKRDRRFAPVFRKWLGMRSSCSESLYELLMISILLQNATVRRTVQMMEALLKRYGTMVRFDGRTLYALWRPERLRRVSEDQLRRLKVGYRAKYLKRLSRDFLEERVDENALRTLDMDAAKRELLKLYGVGPETARILLFEVFHHDDVFDHIAPWQQKLYSRLFYGKPLIPVRRIRADIVKQYGPFAMLAVHYIWEDIFWRRKHEHIEWLEREIRL